MTVATQEDVAPPALEPAADVRQFIAEATAFLDAWRALFESELALARCSLRALVLGMLIAPVLLLGVWISLMAALTIALHGAGLGWLAASASACLVQVLVLLLWFVLMRRWSRDLSLRHSRAVLLRLLWPAA